MNYQLFVSDFDGTLVRADGTISQKNIDAIAAYRRAGGIFAVCTGRMLASILPRLRELGLTEGYVAALQGAQIADIRTGELVMNECFAEADAIEVLRFLEEQNVHIHAYAGLKFYSNFQDGFLEGYEHVVGVKGIVCDGLLSDMVRAEHMKVVKILTMTLPEDQPRMRALLAERFSRKYFVACSSDMLIELMPPGQTKAAAVNFLSEKYHIPTDKIAAIGDQENDAPMLAAAGGKFAVENAAPSLKENAVVVPSFEEDGVAYAIRKYAMGERI